MQVSWQTLQKRQAWPFEKKVRWALHQIRLWYDYWEGHVYVSFSGGKDSTVLLHLVRHLYPEVPAVFCNTGLEFPEIIQFVKSTENVTILRPKMTYRAVLEEYGYPVVSKEQSQYIREARESRSAKLRNMRINGDQFCIAKKWQHLLLAPFKIGEKCCDVMKKRPATRFEKETGLHRYIGTMAGDSRLRRQQYLRYGCNAFDTRVPVSKPLSVWLERDVWTYIRGYGVSYCPVYDMGYERTGCIYCAFTVHMETPPNRFERMAKTHPKLWKHCMETLGMPEVLGWIGVATGAKMKTRKR